MFLLADSLKLNKILKNLKISQTLWLGFGTFFALIIISTIVNQWSKTSLSKSLNLVIDAYKIRQEIEELNQNLLVAETGERVFLYTGQDKFLEPYNTSAKNIDNALTSLNNDIKDPNQSTRLAKVKELVQQLRNYLSENINLQKTGRVNEARIRALSGEGQELIDNLKAILGEMEQRENQTLVDRNQAAIQVQNLSTYFSWGITLLIIGIGMLIALVVTRMITRSLAVAVGVAEQVSTGDLTTKVEITSKDEIGNLFAAFRTMIYNLSTLIQQVQQSGIQITDSATHIAASGKQLEATVTEQVASTNHVVATTKEIAKTSEKLVKTMDKVVTTSEATAQSAGSGQQSLMEMEAAMNQLANATNSIAIRLGIISEKTRNINSIVTTISRVTDQTNLISLNAAIEAEKAGEYGKGFGVVAREIRHLADQSAFATLDIESMVSEMQAAVSVGVMEMDKFTNEVKRSVENMRHISVQLGSIIQQVQALAPQFEDVGEGMAVQLDGAKQISTAMEQLSLAAVQTADTLHGINAEIQQLNNVAHGLQLSISHFKIANS